MILYNTAYYNVLHIILQQEVTLEQNVVLRTAERSKFYLDIFMEPFRLWHKLKCKECFLFLP